MIRPSVMLLIVLVSGCTHNYEGIASTTVRDYTKFDPSSAVPDLKLGQDPVYVDAWYDAAVELEISPQCADRVLEVDIVLRDFGDTRGCSDNARGCAFRDYNLFWVWDIGPEVSFYYHLYLVLHEAAHHAYWCDGVEALDGGREVHHDLMLDHDLWGVARGWIYDNYKTAKNWVYQHNAGGDLWPEGDKYR